MKYSYLDDDMVKITSENGKVKDIRDDREYSEVIVKVKDKDYFVEVNK